MVYEVVAENGSDVARSRRVSLGGVYDNQVEVLPERSDVGPASRIAVTTSERLAEGTVVQVMLPSTDSAVTLTEAR